MSPFNMGNIPFFCSDVSSPAADDPHSGNHMRHVLLTAIAEFDHLYAFNSALRTENQQLRAQLARAGCITEAEEEEVPPASRCTSVPYEQPQVSWNAGDLQGFVDQACGRPTLVSQQALRENHSLVPAVSSVDTAPLSCREGSDVSQPYVGAVKSEGSAVSERQHVKLGEDVDICQTLPEGVPSRVSLKDEYRNSGKRGLTSTKMVHNHREDGWDAVRNLRAEFRNACREDQDVITAEYVEEMWRQQLGVGDDEPSEERAAIYRAAILSFNTAIGVEDEDGGPCGDIRMRTYVELLHAEQPELEILVGQRTKGRPSTNGRYSSRIDVLNEIRHLLMRNAAMMQVAQATNSDAEVLYHRKLAIRRRKRELCWNCLEPFMGCVILVNAIVIGVSTDLWPDWVGWVWTQAGFTLIFGFEIVARVAKYGLLDYFLGRHWSFHWLDLVIVVAGVGDAWLTLSGSTNMFSSLMIVRLCRFARLTRLVRVLRLRMFKELTVLITGCFVGLRTLFWAVVLLVFFIYCLGVACTQVLGQPNGVLCEDLQSDSCSDAQKAMEKYRMALFGSVPRSMFTMFRCFTDGCVTTDGTVLPLLLLDNYGPVITLLYISCFLFVIFGLFNLIMAIFVENTIQNARHDEERRREARHAEHVRVAGQLQEVIVTLCRADHPDVEDPLTVALRGKSCWTDFKASLFGHPTESMKIAELSPEQLATKVTPKMFRAVLAKPSVQEILEDLGINAGNASHLFEVLDANGNGTLEVQEMVHGLMKLRAGSDKTDLVASLLAVRALQKDLKVVEALCVEQEVGISDLVERQEQMQASLDALVQGLANKA